MVLTILLIISAIVGILFFLFIPGESLIDDRKPFWGRNFAHRGLHSKDRAVPENSMAAFTAALDSGYGIELDIHLSKDGEVIVFHDHDLFRMCGLESKIKDLNYNELSKLTLLGTDQKIPRLREVLNLVNEEVPLIIEFKPSSNYKALCKNAWDILKTYDGDFCIQSFDPRVLHWFKNKVPGILRGQLAAKPKTLKAGIFGAAVGYMFTNFIGRPQFISYEEGSYPLPVRFVRRMCMKIVWTVRPGNNAEIEDARINLIENNNDAIIFEFYAPPPVYKDMPHNYKQPEEEDYRF